MMIFHLFSIWRNFPISHLSPLSLGRWWFLDLAFSSPSFLLYLLAECSLLSQFSRIKRNVLSPLQPARRNPELGFGLDFPPFLNLLKFAISPFFLCLGFLRFRDFRQRDKQKMFQLRAYCHFFKYRDLSHSLYIHMIDITCSTRTTTTIPPTLTFSRLGRVG